jgi:hypothetical protein
MKVGKVWRVCLQRSIPTTYPGKDASGVYVMSPAGCATRHCGASCALPGEALLTRYFWAPGCPTNVVEESIYEIVQA